MHSSANPSNQEGGNLRVRKLALLLAITFTFTTNFPIASEASQKADNVSLHFSSVTRIQIPHGFTVGGLLSARDGRLISWGWNLLKDNACGQTGSLEVIKYDTHGTPDQTFAIGGIFSYSLYDSTYPYALTLDAQGNIYISGESNDFTSTGCEFTNWQTFILKLTPNGILDTSFGDSGKLKTLASFPRIHKNILYLGGSAEVQAFTLDGKPYAGFGLNGSAKLANSSLQGMTMAFGDDSIYLSGSIQNPCMAANNCSPNSAALQYGITSVNYQGMEENTFRGNSNFVYSNGFKDGPLTSPILIDDKLYFTGTVLTSAQPVNIRDSFILSASTSGKINSNFGTFGKIWLSTASPSTTWLQYAEKTRNNQLLIVTNEKNSSRNFLLLSQEEKTRNRLISIGSIAAPGYLDQNADGTFLSYSTPDSFGQLTVQSVSVF